MRCHPVSGRCICPKGRTGDKCEEGALHITIWPLFFSDILLSVENTNLCLYSIIQNLFLDSLVCPKGSYGVRCAQRCRCFDNAHCDPVEGTCQCPAGRTGEYCQEGKLAKNTRERSYVYEVKLK